jgi:dTDP-4-dehydrorhamnose reductase
VRILVTGGSGMLGHCLLRVAQRRHEVWGSYHTHRVHLPGCSTFSLDITKAAAVRAQLTSIRPDVVIHTAALTDVDECERSPNKARQVNSDGTLIAAKLTEELGARFVYISTDYVFGGGTGDYREEDSAAPVNEYGKTKIAAEAYTRQHCSSALIIRTTMYGLKLPPKIGMMEALVSALQSGKPLARFTDQYFTPVYTGQLSEIILRLIELGVTGLFHVGGPEKISRYEFSRRVAKLFAAGRARIEPVPFRQIEGLAPRPRDTSLRSDLIRQRFGIELPEFCNGLTQLQRDWETLTHESTVTQ